MAVTHGPLTAEELGLAIRNSGLPLEGLRWDVTPVGMHYVLVHYDVPLVDESTWSLVIDGLVDRPQRFDLAALRSRPAVRTPITFECAGNGRARLQPRPVSQPWTYEAVGTGEWTGTPLRAVLEEAGLSSDAVEVVFTGADRGVEKGIEQVYQRSLPLAEALREDVLLAYELGGVPLPPQHGFPLRLVVPWWYGMANVKWLVRIDVVGAPFEGYQQAGAYRMRQAEDEPGTPVTRMLPRALMVPPGIPDFLTRRRFVAPGPQPLQGRAWSGHGPVTAVDVSTDGGSTWAPARLEPAPAPAAWQAWSYDWTAAPGDTELCARASDAAGRVQPLHPVWNLGGYAVNAVQRVPVTVRPA